MTNGLGGKQSLLAVASFSSALMVFFPPAWVAALVLGIVALVEIKQSGGTLRGRGLAIAGIVLGIVWTVALVVFLAASFASARQNAADLFPAAQEQPASYDEGSEEPEDATENLSTTPPASSTPSATTTESAPAAVPQSMTMPPANQTPPTKQ